MCISGRGVAEDEHPLDAAGGRAEAGGESEAGSVSPAGIMQMLQRIPGRWQQRWEESATSFVGHSDAHQ